MGFWDRLRDALAVAPNVDDLERSRDVAGLVSALRFRANSTKYADWMVRAGAASRLGKIGRPSAIPSLVAALSGDPVSEVRNCAARALTTLGRGHVEVVDALALALDDSSAVVKEAVRSALKHITGHADKSAQAWRLWWTSHRSDRQVLREPQRRTRFEVLGYLRERLESAHKPPSSVEVAIRQLMYGDYQDDAPAAALRKEVDEWNKELERRIGPSLTSETAAVARSWKEQEEQWRQDDRTLGVPALAASSEDVRRCGLCGTDLRLSPPNRVGELHTPQTARLDEHGLKCPYCYTRL